MITKPTLDRVEIQRPSGKSRAELVFLTSESRIDYDSFSVKTGSSDCSFEFKRETDDSKKIIFGLLITSKTTLGKIYLTITDKETNEPVKVEITIVEAGAQRVALLNNSFPADGETHTLVFKDTTEQLDPTKAKLESKLPAVLQIVGEPKIALGTGLEWEVKIPMRYRSAEAEACEPNSQPRGVVTLALTYGDESYQYTVLVEPLESWRGSPMLAYCKYILLGVGAILAVIFIIAAIDKDWSSKYAISAMWFSVCCFLSGWQCKRFQQNGKLASIGGVFRLIFILLSLCGGFGALLLK